VALTCALLAEHTGPTLIDATGNYDLLLQAVPKRLESSHQIGINREEPLKVAAPVLEGLGEQNAPSMLEQFDGS
jgi:hypothetical protein